MIVYEAFRDLVPFVQFKKKREKHPWSDVTFSKVEACNFTKSKLLHGCFHVFLTFTNGTKSRNAPHMKLYFGK